MSEYDFLFEKSKNREPLQQSGFKLVARGTGPFREKYRPQRIQELVPTCAKEQLYDIIRNPEKSQVYLLEGRTGTGKTTCARILAKAYVCMAQDTHNKPCLNCEACNSFEKSFDVTTLNVANQNKIEDIRILVEEFRYRPSVYPYKIYILDEVQRLTPAAQQVLLTELEEPPSYLLILMCTTDSKQLDQPLVDRATRITFNDLKPQHAKSIIDQVLASELASPFPDNLVEGIFSQSRGSVRALLNGIQSCLSGGFDPDLTLEIDDASGEVKKLTTNILNGNWEELVTALKSPSVRANSELLRQGIENYLRGHLLNAKTLTEAYPLGEAMMRISGSLITETVTSQYNQFVLKCLRACYVFRTN